MNAYQLADAAANDPSTLSYIPHSGFRDHILAQVRGGYGTIKAVLARRDGDWVSVWTWTSAPGMAYLSDQSLTHQARTQVRSGEHVRRVRANVYRSSSAVGGEVIEYVYSVSRG